jgi:BMFP domain-containing protein YqiC
MKNAQKLWQLATGIQLTQDQIRERDQLERIVLLETHGRVTEMLQRIEKIEASLAKASSKSVFEHVFGK